MRSLKDKVVLITGGSRGIGLEIARAFARQGSRIALAARGEVELEKARTDLEESRADVVAIPADVGDLDSLRRLVAEVERSLGPIDVLINNAGIESIAHYELSAFEDIERTFRVNVTGTMLLTRLVVPGMIERASGHVVNIASNAGMLAVPFNTTYAASKHAVVGFSRSLRAELAARGVGVSVICPGFVEGERIQHNFEGKPPPKQAGTVTPAAVAKATIDAVMNDRGEVIVNKGLGKVSDWAQAMAPEFTAKMFKRLGVFDLFREAADANAKRLKD